MHQAATRFTAISVSVFLLSFAVAASANPASPNKEKTITLAEGTDVFVTLSPDHKTIIADLQGLLYSLPASGGQAKQITTPFQEASQPHWSAKSDLVPIPSFPARPFPISALPPHPATLNPTNH